MQISGSSFLVTGGSGFIGSHVVDRLVAEDASVVVFDNRVREENLGEALASGRVRPVEGDVTDPATVRAAADGVAGRAFVEQYHDPISIARQALAGLLPTP